MTYKKLVPPALFVVCFFAPLATLAQPGGTILGVVRDPSAAAIPGARIIVRNEAIALMRENVSSAEGNYVFPALPVGEYVVSAEAAGFSRVQVRVGLELNQHARVDLVLPVGAAKDVVVVSYAPPLIETTTSSLGEVVSSRQLVELPLNGRNFLQLSTLQPGVTPATVQYTPNGGSKLLNELVGSTSQVNGLRIQSNNYLLDGADNNEPFYGFIASTPNPDTVDEFKIITNSYTAEYGRGGGGIVNVVTKSGTNEFHGNLFGFIRNEVFDAKNYFSTEVAPLKQYQFGGSLGGPIVRDKAFFFFNYQGTRRREGITVNTNVPSTLERSGDFSQSPNPPIDPQTGAPFPGNVIPPGRINAVNLGLLRYYPLPTSGSNTFVSSLASPEDGDQYTIKVDHNLTANHKLQYNYYRSALSVEDPTPQTVFGIIGIPGFGTKDIYNSNRVVVTATSLFGTNTINTVRFAFNKTDLNTGFPVTRTDRFADGFTYPSRNVEDLPTIGISGFSAFGLTNAAFFTRAAKTFQWTDDASLVRGRHNIKFGADIRHQRLATEAVAFDSGGFLYAGAFSGNAFADYLLGNPLFFLQFSGNLLRHWHSNNHFFYGQDDIRITPTLTLNVGLRWDLFGPSYERDNLAIAFRPGQRSTVNPLYPEGLLVAGDPGISNSTVDRQWNSFAPRVGFAWDPFGKGDTSIRAAYGIFYDNVVGFVPFNLVLYPGETLVTFQFAPQGVADPYIGTGGSPFAGNGPLPFTGENQYNPLDPNFSNPYAQQWHLTIQQEVVKNLLIQAAYVGTKGTHLVGVRELNPALFVPGNTTALNVQERRRYPQFTNIFNSETVFNSTYHSLQMSAKRQTGAFTFLAAYTFSKTIDGISVLHPFNGAAGQQAMPQDSDNLRAEKALAAFDVRHRFVVNTIWSLPFYRKDNSGWKGKTFGHWTLTSIAQAQTGTPFGIIDSANPSLNGSGTPSDRPNLVPGCNLGRPTSVHRTEQWFNTACFQPIPTGGGVYGNSPRNLLRGPSLFVVDVGVFKDIPLTDVRRIHFRAEIFNLFNRPNFTLPDNDIRSLTFGRILNTVPSNERQMQFAVKFYF